MIKTSGFEMVEVDLKRVEDRMREGIDAHHDMLKTAIDYLISAGGKRWRPVIVLLASQFDPHVDQDKAASLAAAVEMLHTATLVHDDFIDNALLRRGMPTLNTNWSPGATILTGDYLFARSAGLAAETNNVRIIKIFSMTLMTMVNGELNQFFNDGHTGPPTREEYFQRIYAKTASLFASGAETGGILAGLPENQVQALHDYGYNLGMAFQIMDDILDFQSTESQLGKPVANDLRQGIATLPVLIFLDSQPNHPTILKAVAKAHPTDDEIQAVVSEIRASGGIEGAFEEAKRFATQAEEALEPLPNNEIRAALLDFARYSIARDV